MDIANILTTLFSQGQLGVLVAFLFLAGILARYFYSELRKIMKEQTEERSQLAQSHKAYTDDLVKQMFEVINKNTESNTKLSEAVKELGFNCHYRPKN